MNTTLLNNLSFLGGGGEMGNLIRAKDWSKTPLGAAADWPQSLRTTLSILLNTRFPMFLWWGPQLTSFYNDAYRPSLGNNGKHPNILGVPAKEAWPEIWDFIKPLIDQVLTTNEATWSEDQLLPIYRNGKLEDVYWTFSYSPVNDESGAAAGVLVICNETTGKVNAFNALEENKKRYYNNIMQAPVAMCIFSGPEHIVELANPMMLELWGKTEAEVLNLPVFVGLPEAAGQGLEQIIARVYQSGEKFTANERPVKLPRNGKLEDVYLNFVYEAFRSADGVVQGIVATASNVTHQVEARKKVEESEQRFRNVADSAPVLIWMADTDTLCNFFNKAWLQFTGRKMEQEIGNGWAEGVHEGDFQRCLEIYLDAFSKREAFYMEYRLRRHDGVHRWISDNGVPRFNSDNVFEGYIGACMDIHSQREYQSKLKENEERLNVVIEASSLGNFVWNFQTNSLTFSDRYLEIFGYEKGALLTHPEILTHIHPADMPVRNAAMQEAIKTGSLSYECRLTWKDGSLHWMEARGRVFYSEDHRPLKLIGTVRDITDAKNHQQELEEREQKFRLLADSMPQYIWTATPDGSLTYFNQSVFKFSGLTLEEMEADGWLKIVHPDDRAENMRQWMEAVKTGNDFHFEHRFRRHDGVYHWQLSRAIPQRDATGHIQMWVGTSTDIQAQKVFANELENKVQERTRQLEYKNKELEKMNVELESFAYVSSHDLQEPLRKIQTFASRINEKEEANLSAKGRDYFRRMQESANRMQVLIEDLLAYSRTNTSERVFVHTELASLIEEVREDLKDELIEKNGIITYGQLHCVTVIPFQFRQLLANLLGNSLKFSKKEVPPVITISTEKTSSPGPLKLLSGGQSFCHISVTDNGIGFDPQYSERIFEVFQRLHSKDDYKGTGIGLAIVKKIVDNHNGQIYARSGEGQGTTFDIYIPCQLN